jgi:hypothetical protein
MKGAIYAIFGSILLVLIVSFFVFQSSDFGITSLQKDTTNQSESAVRENQNSEIASSFPEAISPKLVNASISSKSEAEILISDAEPVILRMQTMGLPVIYANDSLIGAKNALSTAYYASILRGEVNVSESEKGEARDALKLASWKNANYSDVVPYLNDIYLREARELYIFDSINLLNQSIARYSSSGANISDVEYLFGKTLESFNNDQIDDSIKLAGETRNLLESRSEEIARYSLLKRGIQAFFVKYWLQFLIFLIIIVALFIYGWRQLYLYFLVEKRDKMIAESAIIRRLIVKSQEERYKENKISDFIYRIRIKKYQERENYINENLPLVEEKIKRYSKK